MHGMLFKILLTLLPHLLFVPLHNARSLHPVSESHPADCVWTHHAAAGGRESEEQKNYRKTEE